MAGSVCGKKEQASSTLALALTVATQLDGCVSSSEDPGSEVVAGRQRPGSEVPAAGALSLLFSLQHPRPPAGFRVSETRRWAPGADREGCRGSRPVWALERVGESHHFFFSLSLFSSRA